jgi:hypothetical protein
LLDSGVRRLVCRSGFSRIRSGVRIPGWSGVVGGCGRSPGIRRWHWPVRCGSATGAVQEFDLHPGLERRSRSCGRLGLRQRAHRPHVPIVVLNRAATNNVEPTINKRDSGFASRVGSQNAAKMSSWLSPRFGRAVLPVTARASSSGTGPPTRRKWS